MKQKCVLCGVETDGLESTVAGLCITTNVPVGGTVSEKDFLAIFGFWDQRQRKRVDLCGACLIARLLHGGPLHGVPMPTDAVPTHVLRKYSSPKPLFRPGHGEQDS